MRAIRFHEFGDPGVLRLDEIDRPVAGPGQVLVKVAATSFNPVDTGLRAGYLRQAMPVPLPHTPGVDVAGTTEDGRQVIGFLPMTAPGAAAEWVAAPAELLTDAPRTLALADAAAVPAVALTAWQGLFEHAGLQAGQRILINGAGGGVGGYAVQFAKAAGAHVLATASARSAATVREQGADEIVDYTAGPVADAVTEPVDAVFNLVRADDATMAALVRLVRPGGVVVTATSPAPEDAERKVRTISMYVRSDAAQLAQIVERIDAGTVRVDVSARYPLADLARVHEASEAGELRGKVVIEVA
ncbi:NADP-dependent oxidoreductase [Actinoplanes sp. NPDC049548]|uniref:NADP-dependent oxidoreductase n=1 Tax=Actinoplanes sp. NPDC049548 TaxID=3155152 RepID=UPI003427899C